MIWRTKTANTPYGLTDLADDGDIVRGLGFITMYAAWVEENVDDLLRLMDPVEPFDGKQQRWQIGQKLKHAAKLVRLLNSDELGGLPEALESNRTIRAPKRV